MSELDAVAKQAVAQMASEYDRQFWRRVATDPRHIPRCLVHSFNTLRSRTRQPADSPQSAVVPRSLRPPPHRYAGYSGPWFEEQFFRLWCQHPAQTGARYVPVYWNIIYQHLQVGRYAPWAQARLVRVMESVREECDADGGPFFTVSDYDHALWDWHRFPRNVVVFGAGGDGDVAIPLFKGSSSLSNPPKSLLVSFMGRLDGASDATGLRSRMHAALGGVAHFGVGPDWRDVMARSTFTLCPRGLGRASFRFYEALSVSSIPIYLWDDREWLPFPDRIPWSDIIISVNINEVHTIPDRLHSMTAEEISARQNLISRYYLEFLTPEGTFRELSRRAESIHTREQALAITAGRTVSATAEVSDK